MNKITETEIREEICRLCQINELKFLERAINHYQTTGKRVYLENGVRVEVDEWSLTRYAELIKHKTKS